MPCWRGTGAARGSCVVVGGGWGGARGGAWPPRVSWRGVAKSHSWLLRGCDGRSGVVVRGCLIDSGGSAGGA